jgi:DNA-binding NtrC family response regulator
MRSVLGIPSRDFSFSRGKRIAASPGYGFARIDFPDLGGEALRHVLVIDDDPSIRFLCRVNLEFEGCDVREAATLAEARHHLADGAVQVVLLDVHVGPENGVAFLDEIRTRHPGTKVAMLTGSVGGPTLEGTTPDGVISKPFTLEELSSTVAALLPR